MKKPILSLASVVAFVLAGLLSVFVASEARAEDVTLYKNPQCGCCEGYADYLRANGHTVTVEPTHDLVAMSRAAGIGDGFEGCHLSFVDGYVVSGHVPVSTLDRLLSERPDIKGITLPGMPAGSPGMSGVKDDPFVIFEIGVDEPTVYGIE